MSSIAAVALRLVLLFTLGLSSEVSAQAFKPGKFYPSIKVEGQPDQSYALYLPPSWGSGKLHPVLYGFSPGASGKNVVDHYLEGAKRFGWIVVGSNNSRNGSNTVVDRASKALWKDVQARFKTDPQRLYATGMSGGAAVAAWFAQSRDLPFAGTFLHARGEWSTIPRSKTSTFFYLLPGDRDFNLGESVRFLIKARSQGAPAHLEVQKGAHGWAPASSCTAAMRYAEIRHSALHGSSKGSALPSLVKEELRHLETRTATPYFQLAMDRIHELSTILQSKTAAWNRVQRSLKKIQRSEKGRLEVEAEAFTLLAKVGLFDAKLGGRYPSIKSLVSVDKGRRRVIDEFPGTTAAHIALLTQRIAPLSLARAASLKPSNEVVKAYQEYAARVQAVDTDLVAAAKQLTSQKKFGRATTALYHLEAVEQLTRRVMKQGWVKRLRKHPAFAELKALALP